MVGFRRVPRHSRFFEQGEAPEKLYNYELGVKSEWFEKRLRANVTLFHMLYKDMQIESNIPCPECAAGGQQTAVLNVGQATINGALNSSCRAALPITGG